MKFGKTIKLFLIDGEPNGRSSCELSNWTGKAYKIPRILIKKCIDRTELQSTGVYMLFGNGEGASENNKVYIGEAEEVIKRLNQHLTQKDFWNEAIVFISKDDNLNKAHIKYLESRLHEIAVSVARYDLQNTQTPSKPNLSEADIAEMEEYLANVKFLVNILGHKLLETRRETPAIELKASTTEETDNSFYINATRGGRGQGKQTSEGFVVYEGSQIANPVTSSYPKAMHKLRKELLETKVIIETNKQFLLTRDYTFSSPSTAAMIIMGRSANGLSEWKTTEGVILRDMERIQ